MPGEAWWGFLVVPVFVLFLVYFVGKQFDFWDKWFPKVVDELARIFGRISLDGVSRIRFEGIRKFFRR